MKTAYVFRALVSEPYVFLTGTSVVILKQFLEKKLIGPIFLVATKSVLKTVLCVLIFREDCGHHFYFLQCVPLHVQNRCCVNTSTCAICTTVNINLIIFSIGRTGESIVDINPRRFRAKPPLCFLSSYALEFPLIAHID